MALADSSIGVTPGSGAVVATELVNAKEYQAVVVADHLGHVKGSRLAYFLNIPSQVHVNAANTVHWDLFNADPTLKVRVTSILQIPDIATAVTGVVFAWTLARTTAVGTGGTALTAWLPDTTQTALSANVTARSKPTGGATAGVTLLNYQLSSEETNVPTAMFSALAAGGMVNLVPQELRPPRNELGIVLNQNQGLRCTQVTASAAGNTGWFIGFTVE